MSDGFRKWSEQQRARLPEPALKDNSLWVSAIVFSGVIGLLVAGDFAHGAWTKRQSLAKAREERELVRVANERARSAEFERDLQAREAKMEAEQAASVRLNAALDKAMIAAELRRANESKIAAQRDAAEWKQRAEQAQQAAAILSSIPVAAPERDGFLAAGGRPEFLPGYVDRGPGPVTIINTGIGTWMATDSNGNSRTISRTGDGVFMIGE